MLMSYKNKCFILFSSMILISLFLHIIIELYSASNFSPPPTWVKVYIIHPVSYAIFDFSHSDYVSAIYQQFLWILSSKHFQILMPFHYQPCSHSNNNNISHLLDNYYIPGIAYLITFNTASVNLLHCLTGLL